MIITLPTQESCTLGTRDEKGNAVQAQFVDGQAKVTSEVGELLCAAYEAVTPKSASRPKRQEEVED